MATNNLRVIYDNATDRSTITASSTAGVLVASNMKDESKTSVWRSTSTSATITMTWPTLEIMSGVILPFCNLTQTATIRLRGYSDIGGTVLIFDTGAVLAAPNISFGILNWGTTQLGVNTYAYGGGTYGRCWVPLHSIGAVQNLRIDIVDTTNPQGYIECSRIVCGAYWSPVYNAGYGMSVTYADNSVNERSDAGDYITTIGTRHKVIPVDMSNMLATDRTKFISLIRGNGKSKPIFLSIFPNDVDTEKEQTYQIYGKMSQISAIAFSNPLLYTSQLDIEEI